MFRMGFDLVESVWRRNDHLRDRRCLGLHFGAKPPTPLEFPEGRPFMRYEVTQAPPAGGIADARNDGDTLKRRRQSSSSVKGAESKR